jgi:hypothetical protein
MKVELLHIADCANTEVARRLVEEALRELGLCDKITEVEVSDPMQAERLRSQGLQRFGSTRSMWRCRCHANTVMGFRAERTWLAESFRGLRHER